MLVGICNPVLNKDKICNLKLDSDIRLSLLSIMVPACAGKTGLVIELVHLKFDLNWIANPALLHRDCKSR